MALANEQAAAQGDSAIGFMNPAIYPIGVSSTYDQNFHDISSGSNGFPAITGFDLVTGLGSPNGASLINALAPLATTPNFIISPTAISGQQGNNGTSTITLTTAGGFDSAVALTASGQPSGVTVSLNPTSIAAPGSGTSTMTVSVASTTPIGTYPITVSGTGGGVTRSINVSLSVTGALTPTFSPLPAAYSTPQQVTLTDNSPGVTIYYTTNGTTPTTASTPYTTPIPVSANTTINALATGGGYGPSSVASGTYTFVTPPPSFSPPPSTYNAPQTVTLTGTSGVTIYYTTNGTTPTTASTPYTAPIPVSTTTTINAIAAGGTYGQSPVAVGLFTVIPPPDLVESSVSVLTTAPVSGGTLSVSDTTTNSGQGVAANSTTGFYWSTDGKTLGTLLATRLVSTLAAAASSGPVATTFTLPTNVSGTYYMIACADYNDSILETNYANNCTASAPMQVAGADLIESSVSVATTTAPVSGGSLSVSDTATNQGLGIAATSQTGFYLSTDGKTLGTLLATRIVGTLAAAASNGPVTTTITLPRSIGGTYYMIACANYSDSMMETNYTNNCKASAAFQVIGTDLIESSFSVLTTAPGSGGKLSVSDTVTNQGSGTASTSTTGFYWSTDGKTLGTFLATRVVGSLAAGASNGPVTTTITLPTNLNGTYYMIACANYNDSLLETNYANNCTASAPIQVAGADLIESSFSVTTTAPVSGGKISVSDTAANQGLGIAGTSTTGFYFSTDGKTLGTFLATRVASTLAAGANSGPVTTTITLPTNLNGTYYIIACADYNDSVVETSYANNCTASAPMQVAGADLTESTVSVLTTAPVSGGSISVSDTATNQGPGIAGSSTTGFYFSTNGTTLGTLLKTRAIGTLAAGASNGPVTTTMTLPTNLNGTYYIIACANYNNGVVEATTNTNNCTASAPMAVP